MSETDPLQDNQPDDPLNSEIVDHQFEQDLNEVSDKEEHEEQTNICDENNEEIQPSTHDEEDGDISIDHDIDAENNCQLDDKSVENNEIENDPRNEPSVIENEETTNDDNLGNVHSEVNIDDEDNETNVEQEEDETVEDEQVDDAEEVVDDQEDDDDASSDGEEIHESNAPQHLLQTNTDFVSDDEENSDNDSVNADGDQSMEIDEVSIDDSSNAANGDDNSQAESSSNSQDDASQSAGGNVDEEFEDPLVANAIVDLTDEPDESNAQPGGQNANNNGSNTQDDNDDEIVVLLQKELKKKAPTPVPIYVKVNAKQKEKIITDSVDLMCLIQCSICKKNRREIRGHVRTTHKLDFAKYKELHGETMHFSRLTYHRCKICSKLIVYEFWNFRNHLRRAHNMDTVRYSLKYLEQKKKEPAKPAKKTPQPPQVFSNVVGDMCKFQCKICTQSFSFLPEHVKNHHDLMFPQYKEMFGNELKLTTVTYHKCNICQKSMRFDRPTLQKHLGVVHKAKLGAYMKHYLSKKAPPPNLPTVSNPPPGAMAHNNKGANLGSFKVSSSLTITKVRTPDGPPEAVPGPSSRLPPPLMRGGIRAIARGGSSSVRTLVEEPKIFTDNPDDMCLTMCRLCGSELKPKSLSNHLINQHQSSLIRYKAEFGREIAFTKLRYHKCKVCDKTLKFESKQLCYHLTSVHSMSFTQYKEQYLYGDNAKHRRHRARGGAVKHFVHPGNGVMHPPTLWPAGLLNPAVVNHPVAHVLPDLYQPPPDMNHDMEMSEDSNSNPYVPGYYSNNEYTGHQGEGVVEDGEIDPLQCLSVSIDQNGGEGSAMMQHENTQDSEQEEEDTKEDIKPTCNVEIFAQPEEDPIAPGVDDSIEITENPIKLEPTVEES